MNVIDDSEVDVLTIAFSEALSEESHEDRGIILDYDAAENLIGLEILNEAHREPALDRTTSLLESQSSLKALQSGKFWHG